MSEIEVDDYSMNAPKPITIQEVNDIENDEKIIEEDLKIESIEKKDIFIRNSEKVINHPVKKRREMSVKQKAHLQNLIKKNKARAKAKKDLLKEKKQQKVKKPPPKKKEVKEVKEVKYVKKEVGQSNFVKDLRKVDARESKESYYNDMEKMFGLFTRFQEKQSETINKKVEQEVNRRMKTKKISRKQSMRNEYIDESDEGETPFKYNDTPKQRKNTAYKIDFSQYSHGDGYNKRNPYGF